MPPVPFGTAAALGSLESVALSSVAAPSSVVGHAGGRKAINPPLEGLPLSARSLNSAGASNASPAARLPVSPDPSDRWAGSWPVLPAR
jgi:hypothetical protein